MRSVLVVFDMIGLPPLRAACFFSSDQPGVLRQSLERQSVRQALQLVQDSSALLLVLLIADEAFGVQLLKLTQA